MENKKFKKFDHAFTYENLETKFSGVTAFSGYSFTKRNNPEEFSKYLELLPNGYVKALGNKLELLDIVYSGSAASPFLITIAAGRNDIFKGKEFLDIDVFNIAPNTGTTASYFQNQWHHFRDENGERTSIEIAPFIIPDEEQRKDMTYATYLTGSTCYFSMEDYEKEKPEFFNMHKKSFGDLNL